MFEQPISTKRYVAAVGGALALVAIVCFVLLSGGSGGGTAAADAPSPYAAYSVLNSSGPSGLPIVNRTTGTANSTAPAVSGPTFRASPPAHFVGDWPEAASIRKLSIAASAISAWVAKSIDGGLCVLSVHNQPIKGLYPIGMTCTSASNLGTGVYGQSETATSNTRTAVGVVPDGVSAVEVTLGGGTTQKINVTNNAWSLETEAEVQNVRNIEGAN